MIEKIVENNRQSKVCSMGDVSIDVCVCVCVRFLFEGANVYFSLRALCVWFSPFFLLIFFSVSLEEKITAKKKNAQKCCCVCGVEKEQKLNCVSWIQVREKKRSTFFFLYFFSLSSTDVNRRSLVQLLVSHFPSKQQQQQPLDQQQDENNSPNWIQSVFFYALLLFAAAAATLQVAAAAALNDDKLGKIRTHTHTQSEFLRQRTLCRDLNLIARVLVAIWFDLIWFDLSTPLWCLARELSISKKSTSRFKLIFFSLLHTQRRKKENFECERSANWFCVRLLLLLLLLCPFFCLIIIRQSSWRKLVRSSCVVCARALKWLLWNDISCCCLWDNKRAKVRARLVEMIEWWKLKWKKFNARA